MCNMKTGIIFVFILARLSVRGLPVNEEEHALSSCIEMTPENQEVIHKITEEVNIFIQNLADKYQDIDFTLVSLMIEKHSDDEHEDKETVLKIVINDCMNAMYRAKDTAYIKSAQFQSENISETKGTDSDVYSKYAKSESWDLDSSERNVKETRKESENSRTIDENEQTESKSESVEKTSEKASENKTSKSESSEKDSENQRSKLDSIVKTNVKDSENKIPELESIKTTSEKDSENQRSKLDSIVKTNVKDSENKIPELESIKKTSEKDIQNKVSELESIKEASKKDSGINKSKPESIENTTENDPDNNQSKSTEKTTDLLNSDENSNSKLIALHQDNKVDPEEIDIEKLIKEYEEINDVNNNDTGNLYVYAPTIDNSKVEITNNNGENKDLHSSLLEKLTNIEREIESLKQIKCRNNQPAMRNFDQYEYSKGNRDSANVYGSGYGYSGIDLGNYGPISNGYANPAFEVIYL